VLACRVALLMSDYFPKISIVFWTVGLIVVAVGVAFVLVGHRGHGFGRRRYRY
jgi:hypothetical protein